MRRRFVQLLAGTALVCAVTATQAAITCTAPVSTGFSTAYNAALDAVMPNVTQGTVSFSCTRGVAGDPTNLLLRANNGSFAVGNSNRAAFGGNRFPYEAYQDSACATNWTRPRDAESIPFTLATGGPYPQITPVTLSYWGCLTTAGLARAAGTYTDTVTMQVRLPGAAPGTFYSTATFPVSITNPATCTLDQAPGDVDFGTYIAFGSAASASTQFKVTCTVDLPYTMTLDAYLGVIRGLNYSLDINGTAAPLNARGTAPTQQTHTINGNMPAGQAGQCSGTTAAACAGVVSQMRTLTISY